jgi:hypothetical protein
MHKQQLKASRMELRPTAVHYCSYFEPSFNLAAVNWVTATQQFATIYTRFILLLMWLYNSFIELWPSQPFPSSSILGKSLPIWYF